MRVSVTVLYTDYVAAAVELQDFFFACEIVGISSLIFTVGDVYALA